MPALLLIAVLLLGPLLPFSGHAQARPTFQELEESLTCQCGCGLTVHSCNHLQCPSAIPLRAEIREQIALGKDKVQVLLHFEEKYGEKILSAPTTRGFNLLAWTTPFVAVLIGALLIVAIVRRWVAERRTKHIETDRPPKDLSPDAAYADRLEREMRELDL